MKIGECNLLLHTGPVMGDEEAFVNTGVWAGPIALIIMLCHCFAFPFACFFWKLYKLLNLLRSKHTFDEFILAV